VAADPAGLTLGLRQHRQLHEVRPLKRGIEQSERGGIDHVFRIVQQHHAERRSAKALVLLHRGVKAVEAIGLGGRAIAIVHDEPHPRVTASPGDDSSSRSAVVAVAACVDPQLSLRPDGKRMGNRRGNDPLFPPGGDEHRCIAEKRLPFIGG
jgi:hypothetical protein